MFEDIADKLWEMLDAIDDASDAYKDNHEGYRKFVSEITKLRHQFFSRSGGEPVIVLTDRTCDYCKTAWVGDRLQYECPTCDAPMGEDVVVPLAANWTNESIKSIAGALDRSER